MTILYFLRALSELGVYYTLAGTAAALFGGQLQLELLLLQSACFALSGVLRERKGPRLAALLPCFLLLLLPGPMADRLLALPPAVYLAYLAWADSYRLSWERHRDLFNRLYHVVLPAAAVLSLFQISYLLTTGAAIALLTAAASVLLMRSLRHEADVYLQPRYQMRNAAGVALLGLGALVLGSKWTLLAARFLAVNLYEYVFIPLFTAAGMLIGVFFIWIPKLLYFGSTEDQWDPKEFSGDGGEEEEELLAAASPELILQLLIAVAVVITLVTAFVLIYRWWRSREEGGPEASPLERRDLPGAVRGQAGQRSLLGNSAVLRIRRLYREFLRTCRKRGVRFGPSSTSGGDQQPGGAGPGAGAPADGYPGHLPPGPVPGAGVPVGCRPAEEALRPGEAAARLGRGVV